MEALGLNLPGFLWHSANFLLLVFLLRLILWKPIMRILDEREVRVRESLERAEQVRQQTEQAEVERQAMLVEMRRDAEQLRQRSEEQAKRLAAEIQGNAQEEANRILARAQAEIDASRQQMLTEVRGQVADLVVLAVERVTRQALTVNNQRQMIDQFLAEQGTPQARR